jgi:FkbM family methyltransferase
VAFIWQVGIVKWFVRTVIRQVYKHILQRDLIMKLPTGLIYRVAPWDPAAAEAFLTNSNVDWGSERLLYGYLRKVGGTFIDVGAHTGYYSLYMAPAASMVIAVEPDARAFDMLSRNLEGVNAQLVRAAASNQNGRATIRPHKGGFSFLASKCVADKGTESVDLVRVDNFVDKSIPRISAIKIDVDGTDLDVLEGCSEIIAAHSPVVLTELTSKEEDRLFSICASIEYLVAGYVLKRGEYIFVELNSNKLREESYKMLFLAPPNKMQLLMKHYSET